MINFSIYTTAYNLKANLFDWRVSINRFLNFADEVAISTNQLEDYNLLLEEFGGKAKIVLESIPFTDYAFDGKLKNAALQACSNNYCVLLDLDEYIPQTQQANWRGVIEFIDTRPDVHALLIPVIDLFKNRENYKSIGSKWYLHKKEGTFRGPVKFAQLENGKIDISKSDTTELINKDGELIPALYVVDPSLQDHQKLELMKQLNIFVVHEGWLNQEAREKQAHFWKPHWENRAGKELKEQSINAIFRETGTPHNLWI